MSEFLRDIRFGLRLLWKNPGFTSVSLLALMLGIGGTTSIFSIVYASLLAPLPYPKPDQIVMIWSMYDADRRVVSTEDFLDWRKQNSAFQAIIAWTGASFSLATRDRTQHIDGSRLTPGMLDKVVGETPYLGRYFLPEEEEHGKDHVAILHYGLWKDSFGGDRNIVGKQIRLNGEFYTVVGVRPPGYPGQARDASLDVPLSFEPEELNRRSHWLMVMGRLKPGLSVAAGGADMDVIARRLAQAYPDTNDKWSVSVEPLKNDFVPRETRKALWLLLGAVGFVLLIACVNVANLLLAWGTARQKEIAVRVSHGATRVRIFRQFLIESVTLAVIGGVLGVLLAFTILKGLMALMPREALGIPSEADPRINLPVLLFTLAATILSGALFGCAPAWQAARQNINELLKEGGRGAIGGGRHGLRRVLVAAEFALALVLVAGAGLMIHSFWNVARVDLGIRTDRVLTFYLPLQERRLTKPDGIRLFYQQVLERIEAAPGISSAALSTSIPVSGGNTRLPVGIAGKTTRALQSMPLAGFDLVTPGYFQTYGIRLERGRGIAAQDVAGGPRVAVVNESFVRKYLAGADPLTESIVAPELVADRRPPLGDLVDWQIVGVFHDVRYSNREPDAPQVLVSFDQNPWPFAAIAVRSAGDPSAVVGGVSAAVRSIDPDLALAQVRTMDQIVNSSIANERFGVIVFGGFGGVALILAGLGIYGVLTFSVAQRNHEMGIRMALGADRIEVLSLVIIGGMKSALIGLAVGLPGIYIVGRALGSLLYNVSAFDWRSFVGVLVTLLAAALLACYVPARRATKIDPMVALRDE
jgi:putative ABC transport system permease protein